MDGAWVDKLERRFGFLAAPGLPTFVVGMTAVVAVLRELKPEFVGLLALDPAGLARGQAWRAVSFLLVPPPVGALWLVFWLLMEYAVLNALEAAWGEFKLTVFIALGVLATGLGAVGVGAEYGNSVLVLAAFLAFARLMPDREVLVMFVLPVKLRWLAALSGLWAAVEFLTAPLPGKVQLAAGLAPYLLFFGPGHWQDLRFAWRRWRNGLP